jgi:hypothetical protein
MLASTVPALESRLASSPTRSNCYPAMRTIESEPDLVATAPATADLPGCPSPPGCARLGGLADLAREQLIRRDQRERRPRRDDAARCRGPGDCDVSGRARGTTRHQQRAQQEPSPPTVARVSHQRRRRSNDHPVHRKRVSAATQPACPCSSTSRCMCRYDTVPAITPSIAMHRIVVRLIHRSGCGSQRSSQRQLTSDGGHVRKRPVPPRTRTLSPKRALA